MAPHQVEAEQLLQQTVPQLSIIHLILQTQVCYQTHRLKGQKVLQSSWLFVTFQGMWSSSQVRRHLWLVAVVLP